ncbi:MAG: TolC family protein, partial [Kiritimatiellia bacterium]
SARYTSTEAEASDLFSNWITTLAANLVAPVIDGGAKRAEVERARAALSEAINTYGQTVLTALGEVENALVREQRQRELLDSLHRQLELATQVTDQTRERYLRGIGDFLRVLTAELSQQNLERNVLAAERELREFRVALCRALSGGFDLERPSPATLDPTVE